MPEADAKPLAEWMPMIMTALAHSRWDLKPPSARTVALWAEQGLLDKPEQRQARVGARAQFLHTWPNALKVYQTQVLKHRLGFSLEEIAAWYRKPNRHFPKEVFARLLAREYVPQAYRATADGSRVESAVVFASIGLPAGGTVGFDYLWEGNINALWPGITHPDQWVRLELPDFSAATSWDVHEVYKSSDIPRPASPQEQETYRPAPGGWRPGGLVNALSDTVGRYDEASGIGPNDTPLTRMLMLARPETT